MASDSPSERKAQLDKEEREHLEDVVTEMRERVEDNVEFQLTQKGLDDEPENRAALAEETQQLIEVIELEAVDDESWSEAFEQYVTGVGYTIVNRLAALRCMEVRDFLDREVTRFKENGLTPAAEPLTDGTEDFLLEDEAILTAYHDACDDLAEEIEILFDRSSAYSLIDPDDDTFEELCGMLDSVDDEVWRADDVLGWVYEYYNVKLLDDLRRKGDREGLEPEDVPPANQFYTPHWVVRMLTDNSLGKLYLEHTGELQDVVEAQEEFSPDERKNRPLSPDESPDIADFCTYLVPSEEEGEPTDFDHPEELRVIDPACGSGHFLLYAFDVLERIWRAETDLADDEIPRKILQHNLYGIDLDMRACQLAAFNLYLKGRTRAEAEGGDGFDMPEVGIVCADATIAEIDGVEEVFEEVAGGDPEVQQALERILNAFEEVHGLGSLLDVRGTLGDLFEDDADIGGRQLTLGYDPQESHTLGQVLHSLREAVEEYREADSFLAQDLRSFVRLLDILAQDYDATLMNPPYGSQNRMPDSVKSYVEKHYRYKPEFYINFFEVCDKISKENGRIGMLVPRTFMFKQSFGEFRQDFLGERGAFEFLSEFGMGILDNATVRTAGTVVRSSNNHQDDSGIFYRLHDVESSEKELKFTEALCGETDQESISRVYQRPISEFSMIPGSPISYWVPSDVRSLYESNILLENRTDSNQESQGVARAGLQTSDDKRFLRRFWEVRDFENWKSYAKGGEDAWALPRITYVTYWGENGTEVKRYPPSIVPNEEYYFEEVLAFTYIKEGGKRFGYLHPSSIFGHSGFVYIPDSDIWKVMSYVNSNIFTYLMIAQTTGRHWNVGEISKVPWKEEFEQKTELEDLSKLATAALLQLREHEFNSPYYTKPLLLHLLGAEPDEPFLPHPHQNLKQELPNYEPEYENTATLDQLLEEAIEYRQSIKSTLDQVVNDVDQIVFDQLGIDDSSKDEVLEEVRIRTSEKPSEAPLKPVSSENYYRKLIEDVLVYAVLQVVRNSDDGIVPKRGSENTLDQRVVEYLKCEVERFNTEIVRSIDSQLGNEVSDKKEYPNISKWLDDELFETILDRFDNVPPVWEITTSRLVSDPKGVGFECLLDYHQVNASVIDRLINKYIDPRKAELRERRSAANRRRSDESLEASEQAEAADAYDRYTSALEQISAFEEALQNLSSKNERDLDEGSRQLADDLSQKVKKLRDKTENKLETLDHLRQTKSEEWFEDTFSPKFWETVEKWRDEWIDALDDLEYACREYAKPTDEPVDAHLADLFGYYTDRLKGSDHYSSTGILFMTYYFEREGSDFLDTNGQPKDGLQDEHTKHLASLASCLEEYKSLAEEIGEDCQELQRKVPSDWSDRALSEITTTGYQPNRKHGVEINITPLADAEIVPKTVDDDVL